MATEGASVPACIPEELRGNHYTERRCVAHDLPLAMCAYPFTRLVRENELMKSWMERLPLCPDHRDKVAGRACLACEIETWQRRGRATVVIEVKGGIVQMVYSDANVVAILVDHDDGGVRREPGGATPPLEPGEVVDDTVGELLVTPLDQLEEPWKARALALAADAR